MISRRIDLTEHNDFNRAEIDFSIFNGDLISRAIKVYGMYSMSIPDFEALAAYENFFGIKMHACQANDIFHNDISKYAYEMKTHCQRCGAPIFPWNDSYDLCKKCYDIVDVRPFRMPWKRKNTVTSREDPKDIFRLR